MLSSFSKKVTVDLVYEAYLITITKTLGTSLISTIDLKTFDSVSNPT